MKKFFTNKTNLLLLVLIFIGALLRLYNLNWGAPFYFHPDERNIAAAISQLRFPEQMNPHFFAYGSLPIYVIYFTGYITNFLLQFVYREAIPLSPTFDQAIIISRVYSALFSVALIDFHGDN